MFRPAGMVRLVARPGLRPRPAIAPLLVLQQAQRRVWESTVANPESAAKPDKKDKDDGHIGVDSNESIIFFDNLLPLRLSGIMNRLYRSEKDLVKLMDHFQTSSLGVMDPIRQIKAALSEDLSKQVREIVPRLKDGGAFIKFQHDASVDPREIEETLVRKLREEPLRPWFSPFRGIKARLVRGTPWLEDLQRYPSNYVKVEFVPPEAGASPEELSEEDLYSIFRKYGKIVDIVPQKQDDKATPRYATVAFFSISDAIMARNCMHGYVVDAARGGGKAGTRLRMSYQTRLRPHTIWNWITNHPRIVIPIVAALIAGASVIIFDPIRQFFIKAHIQHSLRFTESRLYKWFRSHTNNFISLRKRDQLSDLDTVWSHRRDLIDQLRSWLDGSSDTFIVVTGPKGSGKNEMVMDQTLEGRSNVLEIDCRPITEARGEAGIIRRLAAAVGYRPVFSWANSISSMVDLAVQSTTGVKAGFSETLESQVNKILYTTTAALKEVSLSGRSKKDKDANLSDDAYLEAHPENRPVVVIDNFLHKAEDKRMEYEKIAEWAASIVQNNIAHVIFLTNDGAATKPLAKALPDRVLRTLSLGDLEPDVAKKFVMARLDEDTHKPGEKGDKKDHKASPPPTQTHDLTGLDESIRTMGGRLTDLEFLSRRIRAGQTPKQAVDEIVGESATDIVKVYLLGKTKEEGRQWSTQQAWHLIKALAQNQTLRYNQVLLAPAFASSLSSTAKNGEEALESLSGTDLISVQFHRGRPQTITAGKPLNQAAFEVLLSDKVLKAKMDLAVLSETAKVQAKTIENAENELALLGGLPKQTRETGDRVRYLLDKLGKSQRTISDLEREMAALKEVLNKEF